MSWILLVLLGGLCFSPLLGLLSQVRLENINNVLQDPLLPKSLLATLGPGLGAAFLSVALAVYFAKHFAQYSWKGQRHQRLGLLLPYLVPNFILAMAFVMAWNPVTGLLNGLVRYPGGLYGYFGLTSLFAIVHFPVAFLLLEEKFKRVDPALRESARVSGANSFQVLLKIELPLLMPSLLSALSLCFALNISAFAIPAWIGAPAHVYPLTYKVYQSVQLGGADGLGEASVYALILLILALIPFVFGFIIQKKEKKYILLTGKSSKQSPQDLSPTRFIIFQTLFWLTQSVFWIFPFLSLFFSTLVNPGCLQQQGFQCLKEATFTHYKYVLTGLEETKLAASGSLIYGSISAVIIMFIALILLWFLGKNKKLFNLAESISAIPLATPGAIIALGLIVVAGGRFGFNLYNTPWIVVGAFTIKHLSFAVTPLKTGLGNISSSLMEAAHMSGAVNRQVWQKIVLPLLRPEILGGFFLVLVPILGELTMSVFLTSPSFRSFGTVLFDLQDYADQGSAGALALLLVILILFLNSMSRFLSRGKLGY